MPYGTGSCTYCTCIAKVAFLSIFQFFFILYVTYCKKKIHPFTAKKIIQFDDFFVHELHSSLCLSIVAKHACHDLLIFRFLEKVGLCEMVSRLKVFMQYPSQ